MRRLTPRRFIRAAAYRLEVLANRAIRSSALAADRIWVRSTSSFRVPVKYWPAERTLNGEFFRDWMPLPITRGLATWFERIPAEPNDGGDLTPNCVLICVERNAIGEAFPIASLDTLLAHRKLLRERAHTLVVTRDATVAGELRETLRRLRTGDGVVLINAPSDVQRQAIYSAVSRCFIPTDAIPGDFSAELEASGRPLVPTSQHEPLPTSLDAAISPTPSPDEVRHLGRVARLESMRALVDTKTFEPDVWAAGEVRPTYEIADRPRRVLIASHDLKFARPVLDALELAGHQVRVDHWSGHARHDPAKSATLLAWADTVWCEWTLGNAVWYSNRIGRHQRLVTRMHLQEAATNFPAAVQWNAVDRCIFVAEHVRRKIQLDTAISDAQGLVIPNMVTIPEIKLNGDPARRFRLGLVGMVPSRKGLHMALDVLTELRSLDERFTLSLRGRLPEEYEWMEKRPTEKSYFDRAFERIEADPRLGKAVEFSPFGSDMSSWYERIGVVLSTSDFESFHYTIPDGAVHGALPRLLAWPGADLLYPTHWMQASPRALANDIHCSTRDEREWLLETTRARDFICRTYAADRVVPALVSEILGRR